MAITSFFTNPITIAEILALIGTCFFVSSKKAGFWRLFIIYLLILIAAEFTGYYLRTVLVKPNHMVYNTLMVVQVLFFLYLLHAFHQSATLRKMILATGVLFLLFFTTEAILNSFTAYNKYSRQLLSVIVVLLSCTFYYTLLQNDTVKSPLRYAPFWIVTGLFFYYFGSVVMFAFYEKVSKIKLSGNLSFYTLVMSCLSGILYGCWIIGFIWMKKQIQLYRQS